MDSIKLLSTRVCFASARAFTGLWFIALRVGKVDKDLHSLYVVDHVKEPLTSHMGLLSCIKNPAIWMLLSLKGSAVTVQVQAPRKSNDKENYKAINLCRCGNHWK